jgi:tRNA 2-thiocytidine biosynthesis protein TtcA
MGKAVHGLDMIQAGDHVLVAVSGGIDSLCLLWLLRERLEKIPRRFRYRMTAVHVDPGFGNDSADRIESFFVEEGFEHSVIRTDFGPRAHSPGNRENPCFVCSRLRRKTLFDIAEQLGCTRIAYGHHKDDLIETFFLNLFFGASVSTMLPVQEFFKGKLSIIRPLYLIDKDMISRYAKFMGWSGIDLGCPTAGRSKRQQVRNILQDLYRTNKKIKGNIFHALHNVRLDYLPQGGDKVNVENEPVSCLTDKLSSRLP